MIGCGFTERCSASLGGKCFSFKKTRCRKIPKSTLQKNPLLVGTSDGFSGIGYPWIISRVAYSETLNSRGLLTMHDASEK